MVKVSSLILFALACCTGAGVALEPPTTPAGKPDAAAATDAKLRGAVDSDGATATCSGDRPACVVLPTQTNAASPIALADGGALHPRGFIGDPSVIHDNGEYRMWFTSSRQRTPCAGAWYECLVQGIAYAESADGVTWTPHLLPQSQTELTTLVVESPPGAWDEAGMETASVLRGHDGRLRMFYTGHRAPAGQALPWDAIGLAESDDGIVWKRALAPVFEPELPWERACCDVACNCRWGGVLEPSVLWDASTKTYRMWYAAVGDLGGVATYRIGYATSPDGLSWTRAASPVLVPGAAGAWDSYVVSHVNVVADACAPGLHMFFHGYGAAEDAICQAGPCDGYTPGSIGYAFSTDGLKWTRGAAPILRPRQGAWDGFFIGGPSALLRDGVLELFYFGNADRARANAFESQIARVTVACEG